MKILILCPYPPQQAPSQRFRFEQYLDFLTEKHILYRQESFLDSSTWKILYQKGHFFQKIKGILKGFLKRFLVLFSVFSYDYVLVHREASPLFFPIFEYIIAVIFRKKIIFDFDDAIWLPNTSENNRGVAWLKFHQKTRLICSWAYKISAGNDFLCDYARSFNANVVYNPTTVDTENWHNSPKIHENKKVVIGWTGTHSTMQYLNELLPVFENLEKKYDFELLIISNQKPDFELKSLRFCVWKKETEIADLLQMDIGIMPLQDDAWAKGKCGFKALQYMALGIAAVVSPVGVNAQIVDENENGFLCENLEDWENKLTLLLENFELRQQMGFAARQKIVQNYSVVSNRDNFLRLFS